VFIPTYNSIRLLPAWERRLACSNGQPAASSCRKLVSNLFYYSGLQRQDQRDIIFALLSIFSDAEELGIEPDYTSPVEEVLLRTSAQINQRTGELELLELVSRHVDYSTLSVPSWVYIGTSAKDIENAILDYYPHPYSHTEFEEDELSTRYDQPRKQ
jgi:hypothetical protein